MGVGEKISKLAPAARESRVREFAGYSIIPILCRMRRGPGGPRDSRPGGRRLQGGVEERRYRAVWRSGAVQAMAAMPFLAARVSKFGGWSTRLLFTTLPLADDPGGHIQMSGEDGLAHRALARMRRMAAGESFLTGVRQARSNSRIVLLSIAPA